MGAGLNARVRQLEQALGYRFKDPALAEQSLTHGSYAHESGQVRNNEPLEFLGDAVLGFLVAERIFKRRPDLREGGMTKLRSRLVNTHSLAREAARLEIDAVLLLGKGEEHSGGREKASLLADAFEAVIGAILLDGGIRPARTLVRRLFGKRIEQATGGASESLEAKTHLQEHAQARGWPLPLYRVLAQEGPDHDRRFSVEVILNGIPAGSGSGTSKKGAEQQAAVDALAALRKGGA